MAMAMLLGLAGTAPEPEPNPEPVLCRDGRWRQRVRNRRGGLDTFWGDSAEAVSAQVVEAERIAAERDEQERLARIEGEIRWAEGAPAREEAHRAGLADQPRRDAEKAARIDEARRAGEARWRAALRPDDRARLEAAKAKRERRAAKRRGGQ